MGDQPLNQERKACDAKKLPMGRAFRSKARGLGTNMHRKYQCEIRAHLHGDFISLPFWADLKVTKLGGEIHVVTKILRLQLSSPRDGKENGLAMEKGEMPARRLHPNYDAIGEYAIGSNDGRTLVREGDGVYLDCAGAD